MPRSYWSVTCFLALSLVLIEGIVARAAETTDQREPASDNVAATDQIFTPEYLDRINAAQQAEDEMHRQDRARHDRLIDWYMRR